VPAKDGSVVQIISRAEARRIATLPHPADAEFLAWNPRRPNVLAVACGDGLIYIWDVETGKRTMVLESDPSSGRLLAYHPGGEILASRGWDNMLRMWDTRTGRQVLSRPSYRSRTLSFDGTGRWLSMDATEEKVRILEVANAAECRTLVAAPFRDNDRHVGLAIDTAGRRLVTTGPHVALWDLPTGATLATLPVPGDVRQALIDVSGAVLTEFPALLRWPVREADDNVTTIGPPQMLHPQGTRDGFAVTPDGHTIAAAVYDGGLVFDTRNLQHARRLRPHGDVRHIAISPEGRWVVTSSHNAPDGMKFWDAHTGRLVHRFPVVSHKGGPWPVCQAQSFSPDGRWLSVYDDGWTLFDTAAWTPRMNLHRGVTWGLAFAPDSRTVVFDDGGVNLILAEVETGRELARLEDPDQSRITRVGFTPDGSQVVETLADRPYLRVWDLRAIRRELARLGLDWEPAASSGTALAPGSVPPIPKPFRVDRGQLGSWLKPDG
jgi:WD40 repeat protein